MHVDLLPGRAVDLGHGPAPLARSVCSIFIASSTTSPSPSATTSPSATRTLVTAPGSGARHSPATPPRSSGSSSARRAKLDWPSGPLTSPRARKAAPGSGAAAHLPSRDRRPLAGRAPCRPHARRRRRARWPAPPPAQRADLERPVGVRERSACSRTRPTLRQPAAGTGTRLRAARSAVRQEAAAAACRCRTSSGTRVAQIGSAVQVVHVHLAGPEDLVVEHRPQQLPIGLQPVELQAPQGPGTIGRWWRPGLSRAP